MSAHKNDDDAWERDLQKEFICHHHIPSEKNLIKESKALFAYITESDQKKLMSVSSNYLKFARAKRKELYPPNHPSNRIIEDTFLDAYRMGGPAYECMEWMRIEYDMPNMGPHWHKSGKTRKELLTGKWKNHHDSFIPEYVAEEYEDFNDGVLMYTDGGLMDEINENLKNYSTYDDRVRYIISLLQPFKEFAAAFNSKEQTDERKRAIERCRNEMKSWENVADDAVNELTGEPLEASKQIEACKSFIDKYEQDIKYWKTVEDDFFWLAQHGLGAGKYRTFRCEVNDKMCKCLGRWWSLMITFSRRLAAVILTYGIKLMDIQEQCGIYLNWHFMITDYVDHKFITSIDHAKKLLTDIENNKRKEIGEKLFKSNEEFDAWNYTCSLIRNAQKRIVLVDGYIDERILSLLTKREANVTATIYSRYNETIKTDIEKYNRLKLECYEDYKNELITQDEYLLFKKELDNRIEDTKKAATELSKKKRMLLDGRYEKESFMEKFLTSKDIELKRSLFVRFISQIYVYEDHRIEIMFRYQDEIKQLARLVEEIRNDVALGEVI